MKRGDESQNDISVALSLSISLSLSLSHTHTHTQMASTKKLKSLVTVGKVEGIRHEKGRRISK